jgi:hypothetical protein
MGGRRLRARACGAHARGRHDRRPARAQAGRADWTRGVRRRLVGLRDGAGRRRAGCRPRRSRRRRGAAAPGHPRDHQLRLPGRARPGAGHRRMGRDRQPGAAGGAAARRRADPPLRLAGDLPRQRADRGGRVGGGRAPGAREHRRWGPSSRPRRRRARDRRAGRRHLRLHRSGAGWRGVGAGARRHGRGRRSARRVHPGRARAAKPRCFRSASSAGRNSRSRTRARGR